MLASQHPRTQEMLRLTDGGGGRQSAERPGEEAEIADCSLSLPTLPLGLKRVAWAQAPQSLTQGVRSRAQEKPFRWQPRRHLHCGTEPAGPVGGRGSPGVLATVLASFHPVCSLQ